MKTLLALLIVLPFLLGGCDKMPSEPNVPPESITIVTIPFVQISTTATTAVVTSSVETNGPVSLVVKYGVGNYNNVVGGVPTNFNLSTSVDAKLSDLVPNTKYQVRIQAMDTKNVVKFTKDTTFVTNQLQVGDTYKDGVVISVDQSGHGKYIKKITQLMTWTKAKTAADSLGGKLPTVEQLLQLYPDKEKFGLDKEVYWSSEEDPTNPTTIVKSVVFNSSTQPEFNGKMVYSLKIMINSVIVICSF